MVKLLLFIFLCVFIAFLVIMLIVILVDKFALKEWEFLLNASTKEKNSVIVKAVLAIVKALIK